MRLRLHIFLYSHCQQRQAALYAASAALGSNVLTPWLLAQVQSRFLQLTGLLHGYLHGQHHVSLLLVLADFAQILDAEHAASYRKAQLASFQLRLEAIQPERPPLVWLLLQAPCQISCVAASAVQLPFYGSELPRSFTLLCGQLCQLALPLAQSMFCLLARLLDTAPQSRGPGRAFSVTSLI